MFWEVDYGINDYGAGVRPDLRFAALLLLGTVLLQAAWMFAVPPFRASDEFDHAYRAAGVARGEWRLTTPSVEGRGSVVTVPGDIVDAASAQCDSLPYTEAGNCFPIARHDNGDVEVATGAGPYHPAFYWVIGTVARPFQGTGALYAMRLAGGVLCLALIVLSGHIFGSAFRGTWARLSFMVSLTPVLLFTTIVAAPNGIEICCGLLLWCSLLALTDPVTSRRRQSALLASATFAATLLAFIRFLGPGWLVLIVVSAGLFGGPEFRARLISGRRRVVLPAAGVVAASVAGNAAWIWYSSGFVSADNLDEPVAIKGSDAVQVVVWMLQLVAAFPYRDMFAPAAVYPLVMFVVIALLVCGLKKARGRHRWAIGAAVAATVMVPIALTLLTYRSQGVIWQGRYALPFVVGVLPLCGLVLDRCDWAPRDRMQLASIGWVMVSIAHVISIDHVLRAELGRRVSAADQSWVHPPVLVVDGIAAVGCIVLAAAVIRRNRV